MKKNRNNNLKFHCKNFKEKKIVSDCADCGAIEKQILISVAMKTLRNRRRVILNFT